LTLTFVDPADYERVRAKDRISLGLAGLTPEKRLTIVLAHEDGTKESIEVAHSLDAEQIDWFRAGSAMNAFARGRA
jgi:aconitate hydratase